MRQSNTRRQVRTKKKMLGSFLVKYRAGTGYLHKSESGGRHESIIEGMYW